MLGAVSVAIVAAIVVIAVVGVASSPPPEIVVHDENDDADRSDGASISDNSMTSTDKKDGSIDPAIQQRLDEIKNKTKENEGMDTNYDPSRPREWITSGPFQIDRKEYALGENVFVRMDVAPHEKGEIAFLRPLNDTHKKVYITIAFDGERKGAANQYFKPALSARYGTCSVDDIKGEWDVIFRGTAYPNLSFVINENITVPGDEKHYKPIC